jgi:subtilisin-like proprotein convertase family protein
MLLDYKKHKITHFLLLFCLIHIATTTFAQKKQHWTPVALGAVQLPATAEREFEPYDYKAFTLDYDQICGVLAGAPMEFTKEASQPVIVSLPNASGELEAYAFVKTEVMPAILAAKHPQIGTYSGYAVNNQAQKIRITTSPEWGLKAMVRRADKGVEYIERLAKGQNQYYMVYDRHNFPQEELFAHLPRQSQVVDMPPPTTLATATDPGATVRGPELRPVNLKIYRFACTTTGEFSQDHGGTLASVLATMVDYTNKLNVIYESDLGIRLVLVEDIDKILFLNPDTDPFTGETVFEWLAQNPAAMLQYLGNADRYDIGHVFARYKSGGAIGVAGGQGCTQFKGRGCSAGNIPYGDFFFFVVGQEIGHQWSAGHTWSYCGGVGDSPISACEPGSGTTIMSYSGLCGGNNVAGIGDLYYNACSIFQIQAFLTTGVGSTCGQTRVLANSHPVVNVPYKDGFFIPISTPFELNGSATDADNDDLTYCWEQIDIGAMVPLGEARATSPIFRSFPPVKATNRVFPRLSNIIANRTDRTEMLPAYARKLTFCMTVRDNRSGGGGIAFDTVTFRTAAEAGPFLVRTPNTAEQRWQQGRFETITWDVANTDKMPVNCQKVNIRLSTDGGLTYPITLAEGVPNTGSYCLVVPTNLTTARARIRIDAVDNIFFDISNADFTIAAPAQAGFSLCGAESAALTCPPAGYTLKISTNAWQGFNGPVALRATGLPAGATATFTPATVQPGGESTVQIAFTPATPEGTFPILIEGTSGTSTASTSLNLTVVQNDLSALALQTPNNGLSSVNTDAPPTLRWRRVNDADGYDIEVATNPSFSSTVLRAGNSVAADSFRLTFPLAKGTVYYWRVRAKNACGLGSWAGPFAFSTGSDACAIFTASDLPKNILATAANTVESKVTVPSGGAISDVNIRRVQGRHEFMRDLEVRLIGPSGTNVLLFKDRCAGSTATFNIGFDDGSPTAFLCPPPNDGRLIRPAESLSAFLGQTATGEWTLRVRDNNVSGGGTLSGFALELCATASFAPPILVTNLPLDITAGSTSMVANSFLKAEDANTGADKLIFTLMTLPQFGTLQRDGVPLALGAQFSQADLNSGVVRFVDNGQNRTGTDNFGFSVTDGEGGLVVGTFIIRQQATISSKDLIEAFGVRISPNPVTDRMRLTFDQALQSRTQAMLFDATGRQVRSWQLAPQMPYLDAEVTNLPAGAYLLTVSNTEGFGSKMIIVQ